MHPLAVIETCQHPQPTFPYLHAMSVHGEGANFMGHVPCVCITPCYICTLRKRGLGRTFQGGLGVEGVVLNVILQKGSTCIDLFPNSGTVMDTVPFV